VAQRGPQPGQLLGRLVMVEIALRELDRATAAREQIEVDGLVTVTEKTGMSHTHPLVRVEQVALQRFTRLWSGVLRLDWDPEIDGGVLLPPPHDDDEEEDL
jgi:hypothetical protein